MAAPPPPPPLPPALPQGGNNGNGGSRDDTEGGNPALSPPAPQGGNDDDGGGGDGCGDHDLASPPSTPQPSPPLPEEVQLIENPKPEEAAPEGEDTEPVAPEYTGTYAESELMKAMRRGTSVPSSTPSRQAMLQFSVGRPVEVHRQYEDNAGQSSRSAGESAGPAEEHHQHDTSSESPAKHRQSGEGAEQKSAEEGADPSGAYTQVGQIEDVAAEESDEESDVEVEHVEDVAAEESNEESDAEVEHVEDVAAEESDEESDVEVEHVEDVAAEGSDVETEHAEESDVETEHVEDVPIEELDPDGQIAFIARYFLQLGENGEVEVLDEQELPDELARFTARTQRYFYYIKMWPYASPAPDFGKDHYRSVSQVLMEIEAEDKYLIKALDRISKVVPGGLRKFTELDGDLLLEDMTPKVLGAIRDVNACLGAFNARRKWMYDQVKLAEKELSRRRSSSGALSAARSRSSSRFQDRGRERGRARFRAGEKPPELPSLTLGHGLVIEAPDQGVEHKIFHRRWSLSTAPSARLLPEERYARWREPGVYPLNKNGPTHKPISVDIFERYRLMQIYSPVLPRTMELQEPGEPQQGNEHTGGASEGETTEDQERQPHHTATRAPGDHQSTVTDEETGTGAEPQEARSADASSSDSDSDTASADTVIAPNQGEQAGVDDADRVEQERQEEERREQDALERWLEEG